MRWIKRVLVVLVVLAVFMWGLLFTTENTAQAPLSLVFITLPETSISIWVVGGFVSGGLLGLLICLMLVARQKATLLNVKRQLRQSEQELSKLRAGVAGD